MDFRAMGSSAASLLFLGLLSCAPTRDLSSRSQEDLSRETCMEMFARGYVPERSGQIFLVPAEGNFLISKRDTVLYRFMHGSPWNYDVEIPLLFYGEPFVRRGDFSQAATLQDVAPTILALLDSPVPETMTGRVLAEAIAESPAPPAAIVLLVLDGLGADTWKRMESRMPNLSRWKEKGAWFSNAALSSLPSVTSSGHATIATGTDPRRHGIVGNSLYDRDAGKALDPFANLHPRNYLVPTLADHWNVQTNGRAVILVQGTTSRATVALAGRGACAPHGNGGQAAEPSKFVMAMFEDQKAGWITNDECYRLPEYLADDDASNSWKSSPLSWLGHRVESGKEFVRTGLFARFQTDALLEMIEKESAGVDSIPDLILVNFKTADYVAHQYGPQSKEMGEALAVLDQEIGKLHGALDRIAGSHRIVLAITADHGMPPEPDEPGEGSHFVEDIMDSVHARFDPEHRLILHFEDANHQLYIDRERLEELSLTLEDLAKFLEDLPFIRFAFSEEKIRSAKI